MRRGKRILRRRAYRRQRGHTESRTNQNHSRREQEKKPPRRFFQAIICALLFLTLIALKLLLPGNLSAMRGTLGQWLVRDADFEAAFSALGEAVSGENGVAEALSDAYVAVFGGGEAQEVSGQLLGAETDGDLQGLLLTQRALPDNAIAAQQVLGFAYTSPLSGEVTSPFGWRMEPEGEKEEFHYGIDLAADEGSEIVCFADGTVGVVGESTELGKYLTVTHANGVSTLYAHCRKITAQAGADVKCGEGIACVGQTGNATGPHLHFEVHDAQGRYLNPVYYLS